MSKSSKKIIGSVLIASGVILLLAKTVIGITGFLIWFGIFFTISTGIALVSGKDGIAEKSRSNKIIEYESKSDEIKGKSEKETDRQLNDDEKRNSEN